MEQNKDSFMLRITILSGIMLLIYALIVYKLQIEQISSSEEHIKKISEQSIRQIRLPSVRGRIFTSDCKHILADNKISFDIVFHLEEMRQPGRRKNTLDFILNASKRIAKIIGRKDTLTKDDVIHQMNFYPGLPLVVFNNLNDDELGIASELYPPIQGMAIVTKANRFYPYKSMAAHILGRVRKQEAKSASDRNDFFYYVADQIGVNGLEKKYDSSISGSNSESVHGKQRGLRGSPGKRTVRVDHRGYINKSIGFDKPPKNGNNLVLTIDFDAQRIAEELLRKGVDAENRTPLRGAFILLNADTGAMLAMASSPTYNLDLMVPKIPKDVWSNLNSDPAKPLINRALTKATPGSILKPIIALALLKNGIKPNSTVYCHGYTRVAGAKIRCLCPGGPTDMINGIKNSCNSYFITQGQKLGLEKITQTLRSAGVGQDTGFVLPDSDGFCPTRENVQSKYKHNWNAFDTALLSIGQGKVEVTPLQAAMYIGAIANGGTIYRPYLLKEVRTPYGQTIYETEPQKLSKLNVTEKQLDVVREGMWRVVNRGTSGKAKNNFMQVFGKTGTAERTSINTFTEDTIDAYLTKVSKRTGMSKEKMKYKLRTERYVQVGHRPEITSIRKKTNKGVTTYEAKRKWNNTRFVGFGTYKSTRYVVSIFVEHGKYGSVTCAPIAGQFFEKWFLSKEQNNSSKIVE